MQNTDPIALRKAVAQYFSIKDLQDLCFQMKIPYEDLGGEKRSEKARELVQYAQRRGRFDELAVHVYSQLEQMSQEETTETNQEEIIRLLHSIQADVGTLLTAVDKKSAASTLRTKETAKLTEQLSTSYSTNELRTMCFDLNIEYEDLVGNGKSGKIRALVAYVVETEKVEELTDYIYRTRPHLKPKTDSTPSKPPAPPDPKPDNTPQKPVVKASKPTNPVKGFLKSLFGNS